MTPVQEAPDVDVAIGLSEEEVRSSRERHGANRLTPLPTKSFWDFASEALGDPMLRVLIGCAAVSLVLGLFTGDWIDGVAIFLAVVLVTGVGTLNQLRAQRDYGALDAVSRRERVKVVRSATVVEIDSEELVRGDVIDVSSGDLVPADSVYFRGPDLLVGEAHITGEPDTTKVEGDPLYASSRVLDGSGRAVVTSVGDNTVFGQVRQSIGERRKQTPLQERLAGLARRIGKIGTAAAIVTFAALVTSGLARGELELAMSVETADFLLEALTIAITIVVVAVPEGLPLAVTLSLAYTTRRMARDKALVRELASCETMGAATVVCTDKTGTITSGQMTVQGALVSGRAWTAEELASGGSDPTGAEVAGALAEAIAVNSAADLVEREGQVAVAGNSTEGALLRWLESQGVPYRPIREAADVAIRRDFNSARKHMLTVVTTDAGWRVHMKGAPEVVLDHCDRIVTPDGEVPLDAAHRRRVEQEALDHARRGNRLLALASADVAAGTDEEAIDQNLAFTALFVIADALRPEVPAAVDRCRSAGVRVIMVTGDMSETAEEKAREAGLLDEGSLTLSAAQFRDMTDEEVGARLDRLVVLSRAFPDDKKRLVDLLRAQGGVVAVTGDGVNDAPALVAADVGFSMGSGSNVAREASDIVLVDDNFASLVGAIRWGRSVFENIRKFLQFQLTVNVVALATAFTAALAGFGTPLTAVQLLWVNLIMDSLAALALALEPPTDELFRQPPHARDEPLISPTMWVNVLALGAYMFAVLLVILTTGAFVGESLDDAYRNTFLFNTFVWMQIWNELNARSTRFDRSAYRNLGGSRTFIAVMAGIAASQVMIVEWGGEVFSTVGLSGGDWLRSVALGATVLVVGGVVRAAGRRRTSLARPVRRGSSVE